MSRIRGRDTRPELIVRRYLFEKGFRYRVNDKRLPGTPDIVLPKYRTVIFVNGCFWHGHDCKLYVPPKSNSSFWREKVERNQLRDKRNTNRLERMGWNVLVVWECELKTIRLRNETLSGLVSEIWQS